MATVKGKSPERPETPKKDPVTFRQTMSKKDSSANDPIILSDDDEDDEYKGSTDVLSQSRATSRHKEVENNVGKPPCEECGIITEGILYMLDLLPQHIPHDLPFSEKSMDAIQLKAYLCAVHNHMVNPFNTPTNTNFSTLKEKLAKENNNQACNKCGIHQVYVLALLELASSYLLRDDSLFDKVMGERNDKRNDGSNAREDEGHAFMLRVLLNGIITCVQGPEGTDDHTSEDDVDNHTIFESG